MLLALSLAVLVEPWSLERLDLDLRVRLDPPRVEMSGRATIRAEADSSRPALAINTRARVIQLEEVRAGDVLAKIHPFKEGQPIDVAQFELPRNVPKGGTIEVAFRGVSREPSSQFVVTSGAVYASWVESWYPRPALSESKLASPAAVGTTTLRVPRGWRSVANGTLVSRQDLGDEVVEVWEAVRPVARSFVAAPFEAVETIDGIGTFLLKPRPAIREQARALAASVRAMEQHFGPFPYDSFHIVEVPDDAAFAAASEQGFIMVQASLLDAKEGNLPLFAHEAAHAWWGNVVRTDGPGGKMLSEAAAQYGAVLAIEAVEGEAAARRFLRYSREGYSPVQCALGYFYIWRSGGDKPLSQLENERWDHNLSDAKGHWFYHMVRDHLGDTRFFDAMRSLLRDFAGRQATVEDLRRAFLKAGADPRFLSQWLDGNGAPVLDLEWWSADRGKAVEIAIEQRGEPFELPLELAIETEAGTILRTVQLCDRSNRYFLGTPGRPLRVTIDPNDRMLVWRPEYGPPPM